MGVPLSYPGPLDYGSHRITRYSRRFRRAVFGRVARATKVCLDVNHNNPRGRVGGLLGRGPLSKHTVGSEAEGMEIKYERIARNKTPASIEIKLFASPSAERPLRLRIEGDLLRIGRLRQIVPEPSHSYLMRNGFIAEYPAGVSNGLISISQEPGAPGRLWNRVSVEGGSTLEFVQLVLP